jgi:hypothetical protein
MAQSNTSIPGTHSKEKALPITSHLGIANFPASNGRIDGFDRRQITVYGSLSGDCRNVDPEST